MKKLVSRFIFVTAAMMFCLGTLAQQPADPKPGTVNKKNKAENLPGSNAVKPVPVPQAGVSPKIASPQTLETGIPNMPLPKPILPNMPADVNSKTAVMPEIKKPAPVIVDQQKKQAIDNR